MTRGLHTAAAAGQAFDAQSEDWTLSVSLRKPGLGSPVGSGWAEHGDLRVFFHGLLFDREKHRAAGADAYDPAATDAELVLGAYARAGEAALPKLRGSFAVAVFDGAKNAAIVARDPLGTYPLFYALDGDRAVFASSPEPLLRLPGVSRAFNRAALADHLCSRWPDPAETFFEAVRRVPPSWRVVIKDGELLAERHWRPVPENQPIVWLTDQEAARFDDVFDRAVERCLEDGPTGIFLSGGLDSISIAAVAADLSRRRGLEPPILFSIGFPDPECNESERQKAIARDLGLEQCFLEMDEALGGRPLLEQTLECSRDYFAPIMHPWLPAYAELTRQAKLRGVKTILTGHGGDEWLGVTPFFAADLLRQGAFFQWAEFCSAFIKSCRLSPAILAQRFIWTYGLRPLAGQAAYRLAPEPYMANRLKRLLAGDPYWIAPDRELRLEQEQRAPSAMTPSVAPRGFYFRELDAGIEHVLVSRDYEEQHGTGKRFGVRYLCPFIDPDLIELLCRVPPRLLNEGGRTKGLVRGALARRFPDLGLERQKKVLARSYFENLLVQEGQALTQAAKDFPALSELGVVNGRVLQNLLEEKLRNPSPELQTLYQVICLESWVRCHTMQK